jgi:glycosyltransferase involved in cell wall biosynthesis
VVDLTVGGSPSDAEVLTLSLPLEEPERPSSGTRSGRVGVALKHLKRVVPVALRPRLGRSEEQYRPRPLSVPAGYLRARAPDPAPAISIVTPAGDPSPYLKQTLESVINQNYPRLEYIVVHSGSNDSTAESLSHYRERLYEIRSSSDEGPASAINDGFARSGGTIMAWLNSDDLLLPGTLAYVGRYFTDHPEIDVVYGHCVLLDAEDRDVGIWVTPHHSADSLRWFDFMPQETVFWRRRVWDRVGGLDESLTCAFDWELFSRFHRSGARIVRLPRFLGGFRQHAAQRSRLEHEAALQEQAQVRKRWHGRPLTSDELRARVCPFLLRSLPYYMRYRALARLPVQRVRVLSLPGGPT